MVTRGSRRPFYVNHLPFLDSVYGGSKFLTKTHGNTGISLSCNPSVARQSASNFRSVTDVQTSPDLAVFPTVRKVRDAGFVFLLVSLAQYVLIHISI